MIALILKDIASIKKTLISSLLISAGLGLYGNPDDRFMRLIFLSFVLPTIINSIIYTYDSKSSFDQLLFSMPIKKTSYVLSKLFFPLVFAFLGGLSCLTILRSTQYLDPLKSFLLALIIFMGVILLSSVQLPFILKFGADRSRFPILILYFLIFSLFSYFGHKEGILPEQLKSLFSKPLYLIQIFILAIESLVILLSIGSSIIIMEKKEF